MTTLTCKSTRTFGNKLSVKATLAAASDRRTPPRPSSKHPMRMKHMFHDTHEAMLDLDARALGVPSFLSHHYYFRHPDDIHQILTKDNIFRKNERVSQSKEWLGNGLFSILDHDQHAAMRLTLNPAFRMEYLKQLDKFFLASASQLAVILKQYATAAAATAATASSSASKQTSSAYGSGNNAEGLEMQKLFRLCMLDSIGLTSMKHDFQALKSWQQQQQQQRQHVSTRSSSSARGVDIDQMFTDLNVAFLWQSQVLPVPRSLRPGWRPYISACRQLDDVWRSILEERKAAAAAAAAAASAGAVKAEKQDLLGFLLQAQQQQGADVITDEMIGDEIKTMMFAGTDTSSFTLAMLAYQFATQPGIADRAAAEVQELIGARGYDVMRLCADDLSRLPYLTACVSETLRLVPAGPMTRTAQQDTDIGGFHISKGQVVVANIYSMHRTPDIWPRPDEFLPDRWLPSGASAGLMPSAKNAYLPFGAGARSCIGRSYAMLQLVLTWALLLGEGIRLRPVEGTREPVLAKGLTLHAPNGIYLQPEVM